jgi:hypothetical protein
VFYTARQLEELLKGNGGNGQLVLPYRARLTPNALDWIKARRIAIGYSDAAPTVPGPAPSAPVGASTPAPSQSAPYLWWCDGPCGTAKAALTAQAKESAIAAIDRPADAGQLLGVIRHVAKEVGSGKSSGAIMIVHSGAAAMILANRCPSLRAIVGTCLEAVEQGIAQVAANVLVIEHPHKTLQQVRNLIARFVRGGPRSLTESMQQQLRELASCG